jgi:O-antigen biosynthesis protein WbqP
LNFHKKRIFDLLLAIVIAPLVLLIAVPLMLAIRLDSPGPALFVQIRVGQGKHLFKLIKLRTMIRETDEAPSHNISRNYITRLGKILRWSKLDELPQIWNVIIGDMSFVGPRPCLPSQHDLIAERDRFGIYQLRPGITGIGQLAGLDMSDPQKLAQAEAEYINQQGLLTDLKIIIGTIFARGWDGVQ